MKELAWRPPVSAVGLCALLFAASGCGQSAASHDTGAVGTVGLALQVSPGDTVSEATYTISGPNGFASAGSVAVGDTADVAVVVSRLPIGTGYEMDVSATATDGVTTCEGSATFDVTDNGTSTVLVHLVCGVPSGSVDVMGTVNICPVLDSLGASPDRSAVGGIVALTSSAHDADNGPEPLSYKWAANGVPLKQTSPNLNFACSSVGIVNLTVTASDGDPNPSCADSLTVQVHCAAE